VLHPFDFQEKLFGEDGDVRLLEADRIINVYDLFGDQSLVYDLAHGLSP
jgi:hypothetical protein